MKKNVGRFLFWTPRILSIVFILFLATMSLDVFSPELTFWQTMLGLFIHNIPTFILLTVIIISWRYEIVGGVAFILAGLLYIIFTMRGQLPWYIVLSWSLIIAGPAFLIGILFLINWQKKKK